MSLLRAKCCCNTGRCCILNTTDPNVDCTDQCIDNKTPAQCTALGGVWEPGACADIEPDACIGVCCATTTAGYFVACQEEVTQCECFSDNLAVGVTTTWHSGPNLTCFDIACPCQCPGVCPCTRYITYTKTETYTNTGCIDIREYCSSIIQEITVDCDTFGGPCNADGSYDGCDPNYIPDLMAYINSLGYTESFFDCDDYGTTSTQVHTISFTSQLGVIVCPNPLCTPSQVTIGTNTINRTCQITGGDPFYQCACPPEYPIFVSEVITLTRPSCNTCGNGDDCVHLYDDCAGC